MLEMHQELVVGYHREASIVDWVHLHALSQTEFGEESILVTS